MSTTINILYSVSMLLIGNLPYYLLGGAGGGAGGFSPFGGGFGAFVVIAFAPLF